MVCALNTVAARSVVRSDEIFPAAPVPYRNTICKYVESFRATDPILCNMRTRRRDALREETVDDIVLDWRHICKKIDGSTFIADGTSASQIDVQQNCYIFINMRQLWLQARLNFVYVYLCGLPCREFGLTLVLFNNEVWFYLSGYLNRQNNR